MDRKKNKGKERKNAPVNKRPTGRDISPNKHTIDTSREFAKAVQYHQSGQLYKAEEIYKKVLEVNPNHSKSLCLLGVIAHHANKNDMALNLFNRAIQCSPGNPTYYNYRGNVFREQGRSVEAMSSYQKALEAKPDYAEAHINLGNVLKEQGKLNEAITSYQNEAMVFFQRALDSKPDYAEAYFNIGNIFQVQGNINKAISCFQKGLKIKPNYAEVLNNMGIAFKGQGNTNKAISCFQKALELKQDYAVAYYNIGSTLIDQDKTVEAITYYQKALDIKPDYAEAYSALFHQFQKTCDWQKTEDMESKLDDFTAKALEKEIKSAEPPFLNLARHTDPSLNFAVAKSWGRDIAMAMSTVKANFSFIGRRTRNSKIIVGYLSNDFRNHAMAHLMIGLFGLHNRDEFSIFCYSYGDDDGSYYRSRIRQECDKFVDIRNLSHADAAKCIYKDHVDILVDLKGYTTGNRLEILALRPAPVQVRYLGLAGTAGAGFFDYIITDRIVTPEDHARYYSENFVYMPHCYQVNDNTQIISKKDRKRTDFGLPQDCFVFCSFNQGYKIGSVMFDTWINILKQVPEGVLWLKRESKIIEENLGRVAESRGIDSARLLFSEELPKEQHLERLVLADIALDTRIVNGMITTSDALWAGVPVITLQGGNFSSRASSSILTAIGLPELITQTLEEYKSLAINLAHNPDKLQKIRKKIAKNRLEKPLFDTPGFTRNIEKAYQEMWKIFVAGEKPRRILL